MTTTQQQLADLTQAVADYTNEAAELNDRCETAVVKTEQDAATAKAEADRSKGEADKSAGHRSGAETAQAAAEKACKDTEAIAYEGEASLTPGPGKLGIADSEGKFHHEWLRSIGVPTPDFHLPLVNDLTIAQGKGTPYRIDVSPGQDGSAVVDLPMYKADFARASKATYVNKNGILVEADIDEPRFEKEGILIEGSSTNLILNSEHLGTSGTTFGAGWGIDQGHGGELAPKDMVVVNESGREVLHLRIQGATENTNRLLLTPTRGHLGVTDASGKTYTLSVMLRDVDSPIPIGDGMVVGLELYFIGDGGSTLKAASTSLKLTDKLQLVSVTEIAPDGTERVNIRMDVRGSGGDLISNKEYDYKIGVASVQLEELPFTSSYIPTKGTAATRIADSLSFPESSVISPQFTLSYVLNVFGTTTKYSNIWYGKGSRRNSIKYGDQEQGFVQSIKADGAIFSDHYSQNTKETYRISYVSDDDSGTKVYKNGIFTSGTNSALTPLSTLTTFELNVSASTYFHIRELCGWKCILSPEQIYNL